MAKEDKKKRGDTDKGEGNPSFIGRFLPWIIMGFVVVISAGAGFGLGSIFAGSAEGDPNSATQVGTEDEDVADQNGADETVFYQFDPVTATINEPGLTRYVRITLNLEIPQEENYDPEKGPPYLAENRPLLTDWLQGYLSDQTLEDLRGERNINRMKADIRDAFNEILFPDSKPKIKKVLFKEFAIQ